MYYIVILFAEKKRNFCTAEVLERREKLAAEKREQLLHSNISGKKGRSLASQMFLKKERSFCTAKVAEKKRSFISAEVPKKREKLLHRKNF